MKKIYVNKSDSVAAVIDKILGLKEEKEIVLYLPQGTLLGSSKNNFKLLKREADSAGKAVFIESSHKETRGLAESMGLKGIDPLLGKDKRIVSDIIAPPEGKPEEVKLIDKETVVSDRVASKKAEPVKPPLEEPRPKLPGFIFKKAILGLAVLGLLSGLLFIALFVLPRVEIKLVLQQISWNFNGSLVVDDTEGVKVSNSQVAVKGESFVDKKNMTSAFPASGTKLVQNKASGKIIVYNAFSSSEQSLVKGTRLSTPDGKIFRLDKSVTIPGAKIVDAKIVPSSVEVAVTADKAGEEYNIPPTPRFRIPGFQGTAKYEGFYGESKEATTGGFVGEVKVPTESDIASAKDQVHQSLAEALTAQSVVNLPTDIKILNGASQFVITKEEIEEVADKEGKFKVTAFAEKRSVGFREADLLEALGKILTQEAQVELVLKEHILEYGEPRVDWAAPRLSVAIDFQSKWGRPFNESDFKKQASGKNEKELKELVLSLPGIKSGGVRLWPFWVRQAPREEGRIKVDVKYEL